MHLDALAVLNDDLFDRAIGSELRPRNLLSVHETRADRSLLFLRGRLSVLTFLVDVLVSV